MDDYKENPVVMFGHDYKTLPVGKCDSLKLDSKGWQAKTVYANTDKATEIYEYRRAGFPLAESIGFIPIESISQGESGFDDLAKALVKRGAFKRGDISKIRRIHSKWAMLEYSDVPIPSNPEALQVAIAKGLVLPETLIDDIVNAPIVDLAEEPKEVVTKPEETAENYRIPVPSEEGKHEDHRIRTIDVSGAKGIKALYCGDDKKIITYMFDKERWGSMKECQDWMKEHMGKRSVSQAEIKDEIDFTLSLVKQGEFNDENKTLLKQLAEEIGRIPGCDNPVDKDIKPEDAKPVEKQEAPILPTLEEIQTEFGNIKF